MGLMVPFRSAWGKPESQDTDGQSGGWGPLDGVPVRGGGLTVDGGGPVLTETGRRVSPAPVPDGSLLDRLFHCTHLKPRWSKLRTGREGVTL